MNEEKGLLELLDESADRFAEKMSGFVDLLLQFTGTVVLLILIALVTWFVFKMSIAAFSLVFNAAF